MSVDYLNQLTENASRLGARIQESISEHTKDFSLKSGDYDDLEDRKTLRKQLDSSSDREKMSAMKKLVGLISKGRNVSEYFAQVVKNVASHNLEIRKLVYIYLLKYAEQEPDLTLLSINTFQKDLADSSPLIRAMALRVLSGIKLPMIGNIVVLSIKKCAADPSPYVRKAAALAIPKCYEMDTSHLPSLIEIISTLLRDRSPLSIGCVAIAFNAVCPTRLDLLHSQYRRLCRTLIDVDEWGQVEILNLLLRYARIMLPRPSSLPDGELDKDVKLLLTSTEPLFHSRNPAVVFAAAEVLFHVAPPMWHEKFVQPLLRLLHASPAVERVTLTYISIFASNSPRLFSPHHVRFFLRSDDLRDVKGLKLRILTTILSPENHQAILRELFEYADDPDDVIVSASIHVLGKCAMLYPDCTHQCLTALVSMIKSHHDAVVSSAISVLKSLVQKQLSTGTPTVGGSKSPISIVSHLAQNLNNIRHPNARTCVVWLVGQYAPTEGSSNGPKDIADWAPDVLRQTAKSFSLEASAVKLQIVTLAAKLFTLCPTDKTLTLLAQYVFTLARYDPDYDVRDRGKMLSSLLAGVSSSSPLSGVTNNDVAGVVLRREQVRLVLFDGKSSPNEELDMAMTDPGNNRLSALSTVTGKYMGTEQILPDWLEKGVDSTLRDTEEDIRPVQPVPQAISSRGPVGPKVPLTPVILTPGVSPSTSEFRTGNSKGPWQDLDKFYEESESSAEDELESEEEEETEGEWEEQEQEQEDSSDSEQDNNASSQSNDSTSKIQP